MNPMMINNNPMRNQIDQNLIFQKIQKNNEQIIQMIQQIFQVQMLNNMLFNQIIDNKLNNNNINNNMLNNLMSNMNNLMNNMINNPNMQMINNNMMNNLQNNDNDPWVGNNASRINILFETPQGININIPAPENISIEELIEAYFQRRHITNPDRQNNFNFLFNAQNLNRTDRTLLKEKFLNFTWPRIRVNE